MSPFTTGRIEVWNGTKDGEDAYLDSSTGETNLNPKTVMNVEIHDLRALASQPNINENGFEFLTHPTSLSTEQFLNNTTDEGKAFIRQNYWPEIADLVQGKTGATKVIPWHFSVRKQTLGYHPDEVFFMKTGISQPSATMHIDNSHDTAIDHMTRELGDEKALELIKAHKRWAIINVWRPVGTFVQRWPLLVVDHSKVDFTYEKNTGRVYRRHDSKYYKSHDNFLKWEDGYVMRYVSNMRPEEVIVFKDYDSRRDKVRGTPHGSFQDDNTADDAPARNSIEVRVFAFFDDEN
ncbi:hypothetical protein F5B21DRAFT_516261 [Xylaria acuta]|nr:hypothetical protein F5B21DRAFT_516261 [Xylaria acuta]